jgi:hypothetical protein
MRTDWSWERSAREYQALYTQAIRRRRDGTHLEAVLSGIPREPLEIELPPVAEIPSDYGNDRLVVLARDPSTIFVQWDLSGPAGRSHFASGGDSALELVVRDEGTGREDIQRLSRGQGECFLNAASAARLSVWIRASGPGGARVLAASDPLTMPPDLWPPE